MKESEGLSIQSEQKITWIPRWGDNHSLLVSAVWQINSGNSQYQEFEKYRDLLKENPELMDRVNAFRGNNFRLQNEANRDELFRGTEQLNRESRELRRDPLVNAFLDAELALCKLMQKICRTLTEGIDLDILEL